MEYPPQKPFVSKLHVQEIPKLQGSLETILVPEPLLETWGGGRHCGLGINKSVFRACVREIGGDFQEPIILCSLGKWMESEADPVENKVLVFPTSTPPILLHLLLLLFLSWVFLINLCNPMGSL